MLPTPKFHHLHLNSVDTDTAIDFYPTSSDSRVKPEASSAMNAGCDRFSLNVTL
jgi:hypothetical protein